MLELQTSAMETQSAHVTKRPRCRSEIAAYVILADLAVALAIVVFVKRHHSADVSCDAHVPGRVLMTSAGNGSDPATKFREDQTIYWMCFPESLRTRFRKLSQQNTAKWQHPYCEAATYDYARQRFPHPEAWKQIFDVFPDRGMKKILVLSDPKGWQALGMATTLVLFDLSKVSVTATSWGQNPTVLDEQMMFRKTGLLENPEFEVFSGTNQSVKNLKFLDREVKVDIVNMDNNNLDFGETKFHVIVGQKILCPCPGYSPPGYTCGMIPDNGTLPFLQSIQKLLVNQGMFIFNVFGDCQGDMFKQAGFAVYPERTKQKVNFGCVVGGAT